MPLRDPGDISSSSAFLEDLRDQELGDLVWQGDGILVAISGRIQNLGPAHLQAFSGRTLARPPEARAVVRGDDRQEIPGGIEGPALGNCYLVEAPDGTFALVRAVGVFTDRIIMQWIWQPTQGKPFSIPKAPLVSPDPPKATRALIGVGTEAEAQVADVERAVQQHVRVRSAFIASMQAVIEDETRPSAARAKAMEALGRIGASEASALLSRHIDMAYQLGPLVVTGNPMADPESTFPAMKVLVKMGMPAVDGILAVLSELPDENRDS
ncbi:MAG: hypothetical protein ACYS9X_27740, partial [Planctomycetota bacterium]